MAQQAVFSVLERIGSIAVDEAIYLSGVSGKLESAKKQLLSMKAFLKDLDDKMLKGGHMAMNLFSEVREVAYEVEDIIDTANIMKRESDPKISITTAISKYVAFPIYLTHQHELGARIDSANARLKTIFENFEKFNIVATAIAEEPQGSYITEDDAIKRWRSVHRDFGKLVDVIGFDEQIEQIKGDLLEKENKHLSVVSIVGPGGAGKSTMAKKVYGLAAVKEHFEGHAWITVSQRFVARDLFKEMVKGLVPSDILELMITIEREKAELERLMVPSHLIEEVLQHIIEKGKEAKRATKLRNIPRRHLEDRIKHAIEDRKAKKFEEAEEVRYLLEELIKRIMRQENAEEAKVKEVEGLEKLVPCHLLEKVLQRIIEDKKATHAEEAIRSVELDRLKEKIKHAMEDFEAKESKETELRYPLEELIKHAMEDFEAKESKETELKAKEEAKESEEMEVKESKEMEVKESKEMEVKYLLEALIKRSMEHRTPMLDELEQEQLMKLLHKFAQRERYLIVLDDIWNTDAWDIISAALPDKKNGSRVILTTRNEDVAQHPVARKKIHKPKLLNEEDSTQLLLSTALPEYMLDENSNNTRAAGQKLEELKELGKVLALKCGGLPLAIVVLGGHLSRKPDVNEWKRLTSSMDWQDLVAGDRIIGGILDLSFYDMPSNLRSCYLYTTAFPEDLSIEVPDLTSLWVAEGFIPLVRGQTRKEVAVKYVAELAQRCMIQVEERAFSGRIMVIKVHDVLRDWGIGRARREGLVKDCYNEEDLEMSYHGEVMEAYRVVLHGKLTRKADASKTRLRTILDFKFSYTEVMANSLRTVRVLYINSPAGRVILPKEIALMRYLRYLGLGGKGTYFLPPSIGGLLSLETFHATGIVKCIPGSLWKIQTLRHVYAIRVGTWSVPKISSKSKLKVMVVARNNAYLDTDLAPGKHIGTVKKTKQQIMKNKSPGISCCFVTCYDQDTSMDVVGRCEGSQFPYYLSEVDSWVEACRLKMRCRNLLRNDQDILELGRLQSLQFLEIGEQSYTGPVITCPSGSFPQLLELVLHDLALADWKIERGSMPLLERLKLCKCPNLSRLPEELLRLKYLRKLDLIAMPPSFYQEGTVTVELEKRGWEVFVSSNERDLKHLDFP